MYRSSVMWGPLKSLLLILNWSIEIFSFSFWSINIIFACHHLEVWGETTFNTFSYMSLWWFRINWLSSFPIKLNFGIEKMMISNTIRWSFINILKLIGILMLSTTLIEILFVLSMIAVIVFTICYICSIIPWG